MTSTTIERVLRRDEERTAVSVAPHRVDRVVSPLFATSLALWGFVAMPSHKVRIGSLAEGV
jgi:hypothetical protein